MSMDAMPDSMAPTRPGDRPAPSAELFDGLAARRNRVVAALEGETLALRDAAGALVGRWPLAEVRRVPGSSRAPDELRLMKNELSDVRLTLRDAELIRALRRRAPGLDRGLRAPGDLRRLVVVWAFVAVGAAAAIVFVGAPMLADRLAPLIPVDSELALGRTLADEIVANGIPAMDVPAGACDAPEGAAALARMAAALEPHAGAHLPLTVRVLDGDLVNAFALPGGQIFLVKGLLETARSPDEVAGVLAHEIGHVVARDPIRSALRGAASGVVVAYVLGDVVGGVIAAGMVAAVIDARYSRDAEAGADALAIEMLKKADVPLEPFAGFFARLRALYGDGGGYLASHPENSAREAMVRAALGPSAGPVNPPPILPPAEWAALRAICGGETAVDPTDSALEPDPRGPYNGPPAGVRP